MALNQEFQMKISLVAVTCTGIIAVTVKRTWRDNKRALVKEPRVPSTPPRKVLFNSSNPLLDLYLKGVQKCIWAPSKLSSIFTNQAATSTWFQLKNLNNEWLNTQKSNRTWTKAAALTFNTSKSSTRIVLEGTDLYLSAENGDPPFQIKVIASSWMRWKT